MLAVRRAFFPRLFQQKKPTTLQEYVLLPETISPGARTTPAKSPRHRWRDGYHFGLLCCTIIAATVLVINIILVAVMPTKVGTLPAGDCEETNRLNIGFHVVINILSTLLLGASNYSMQCLVAPTRRDINKAHRQNIWLDIGVPSIRNILHISWSRRILWGFLLVSSVPLHLLYNSVIYADTSISEWAAFTVTENFTSGADYNATLAGSDLYGHLSYLPSNDVMKRLARLQDSTLTLTRLEVKDCLKTYKAPLISAWSDVLVVSTYQDPKNSYLHVETIWNNCTTSGASPCCLNGCRQEQRYPLDPSQWKTPNFNNMTGWDPNYVPEESLYSDVSHCMAAKAQQHCKISFSGLLMSAVIVCNFVKVVCMASLVWTMDPYPLATVGDAIASFLNSPDSTTAGICLGTKVRFGKTSPWNNLPLLYYPRRRWRFHSSSLKRWLTTTFLCGVTLLVAVTLLGICLNKIENSDIGNLSDFSLGFGATNTEAMINVGEARSLVANTLLANSPQLLLSLWYFAYNSLWTSMCLADEWSSYSWARKHLRVTSPTGKQRSTYRLQLPYRYSIPLLAISGTLHWLVSQSIFLVSLSAYTFDDTIDTASKATAISCGFSPIALLTTISAGFLVLALSVGNGFRRYKKNGMPLDGSCSAVISAACHPPPGDEQASGKRVMWGACASDVDGEWVRTMELDASGGFRGGGEGGAFRVGHCSFSSLAVEEPVEGELYAGLASDVDVLR